MTTANGANGAESIGVDCAGGARALGGGGVSTDPSGFNNLLIRSVPLENNSTTDTAENGDTPTGWLVEFANTAAGEHVTVTAICTS